MNLNEIICNSFSFNKAKKMITFGKRCKFLDCWKGGGDPKNFKDRGNE